MSPLAIASQEATFFIPKISGTIIFIRQECETGGKLFYLSLNTFIMKRLTIIFCSTIALSVAACNDAPSTASAPNDDAATTRSDSTATTEAAPPMDSAAAMKAWEAYMTPGKPHELLKSQDGKWDAKITSWMAPGAPPSESKGTATNRMILGNRYQETTFTGSFDGMPFEGLSIVGYDNIKKVFISTWVDNMGTGVMRGEGTYDEASKTITLTGTMMDPTIGKDCKIREVLTFIDEKTHKMEMYNTPVGGSEFKSMEIVYTKK